jgi:hypothetical protein
LGFEVSPRQIVPETLSRKKPITKKGWKELLLSKHVGPSSNLLPPKKRRKRKKMRDESVNLKTD